MTQPEPVADPHDEDPDAAREAALDRMTMDYPVELEWPDEATE